ncbi:MAG: molybdenum cofactor guanylyltransferase [Bacteroidetes bacterium]|nr:molybdenum cofactor guanylyltransferase [Bacteroidota bacterium]
MIAAVLAGGKSTRFGRNKLAEPINGTPLLERVFGQIRPYATQVWMIGQQDGLEPGPDRILYDTPGYPGPLGGVVSVLKEFPSEPVLFLAGDLPCLSDEGLKWFLHSADPLRLTIPVTQEGNRQVLHSLCPVTQAKKLHLMLERGDIRSLDYFFGLIDPLLLPVPQSHSRHFLNLNTPEDLIRDI